MFSSLVSNTIENIDIVEKLIDEHQHFLSKAPPEHRLAIKEYSVAASTTRLYAIYENYIRYLLSDYLDSLSEIKAFDDLPDVLKISYRAGISHILGKIDRNQYKKLKHENIIKWYHEALENKTPYKLVNEALIWHDSNFRLKIVKSIFSRLELTEFEAWLTNNNTIRSLFEEDSSTYNQLDSKVNNFVQLRNNASHGVLDNLVSKDELIRNCRIIGSIVISLAQFLSKNLLHEKHNKGDANQIGIVTEVFKANGAFIAQLNEGERILIGERFYFTTQYSLTSQVVESIMVNNIETSEVISLHNKFEVGIKCPENTKIKAQIFRC